MQQGTAVIFPELSTFLQNGIATLVLYGGFFLVFAIVIAAIRLFTGGDDVDLKSSMKSLIIKLAVGAFLLFMAYPIALYLQKLTGQ